MCSPSATNVPEGLDAKELEIWNHVLIRYADEIFNMGRLVDKQWETAMEIFEKVCRNKGGRKCL